MPKATNLETVRIAATLLSAASCTRPIILLVGFAASTPPIVTATQKTALVLEWLIRISRSAGPLLIFLNELYHGDKV
jgi:hypothetical protein